MTRDLTPEDILKSLERGQLGPFYLFYGPGEFRLEKVLDKIRNDFVPASLKDLNLEIFYGGEKTDPAEIMNRARSLPFLAGSRLTIIRRTESFSTDELETFLPYLEKPAETTCLIFIASKTDFRKNFYKRIRELGRAVNFTLLDYGPLPDFYTADYLTFIVNLPVYIIVRKLIKENLVCI